MIQPESTGDGTVLESHLSTFVEDIQAIASFSAALNPDKPDLWRKYEHPFDKKRKIIVVNDTKFYDGNFTPRMAVYSVSFEEVKRDLSSENPLKVLSSYQVLVDTMDDPKGDPTYAVTTPSFYYHSDGEGGWLIDLRPPDLYRDRNLGIPIWAGVDLDPEEIEEREAELAAAEEVDRLNEALRLEPAQSDLARFNQFHGPLLAVHVELGLQ